MKFIILTYLCLQSFMITSQNQLKANSIENKLKKCSNCNKANHKKFNSCEAINKLVDIENDHLIRFNLGLPSKYYGTVWREHAEVKTTQNYISQYKSYLKDLEPYFNKPDSMHCTIYAYKGLKEGFTTQDLNTLEKTHRNIWKSREVAGWSIGYILVKYFNWKAYLIINKNSKEYHHCLAAYNKTKSYPVWKQPNIPLETIYTIGEDDTKINNLLLQHEFGWGFSEQGIHTWVTRYNVLKECNWLGAPSKKYQETAYEKPLFISTNFEAYTDYNSHVIVFPPKE